ncbi:MAG: hypothetical protein ACRD0G_02500 [Acidimicrobiales bacterium]
MPKASRTTASETVEVPGYEGHLEDFDGGYTAAFERYSEDADLAPAYAGLPDDRCQCEHWGYVLSGSVTYRTAAGEETFGADDAYYVAPGHTRSSPAGPRSSSSAPPLSCAARSRSSPRTWRPRDDNDHRQPDRHRSTLLRDPGLGRPRRPVRARRAARHAPARLALPDAGADAASAQWKAIIDQFDDFRVTWLRATPTDSGVLVEWEMHVGHCDSEHLCRQADVLLGDGDKITEHVVFCTGMWDAATIARQQAEAPMVR